jgi:hypothetical protein
MKMEFFDPVKILTCSRDKEINSSLLAYYINKHKSEIRRYEMLWKMYYGRHVIVDMPLKEEYKPDNRLVANFARILSIHLMGILWESLFRFLMTIRNYLNK